MRRRTFLISAGSLLLFGCGDRRAPADPTTPSPTASPGTPPPSASPTEAIPATPTPSPAPTATPVPPRRLEPAGFPIDSATRVGLVTGPTGSREVRWGEGPAAFDYSREDQPSADPARANAGGWNARVHVEYEGQPAVDWYLPAGTPVVATMDGTATLFINTVANPFDVYAVSREPYIGNPDRARAPVSPFPGPGGGQGVFVRIVNSEFRVDAAHLDLVPTLGVVPAAAFLAPYTRSFDYASAFAVLRDFRVATAVATWSVTRGDVVGFTGDTGYSEAPHLHYAIRRAGSANALCPTLEPGFNDAGWLFRSA